MSFREPSKALLCAAAVLLVGGLVLGSSEAKYPEKPITLIVPWAPGGASGMNAVIMSKPMSEELKQPVVIVYKPGAAGVTGTLELERSAPDGYTIGTYSFSQFLTQYTTPIPTSLANIVPLSRIFISPATLTVSAKQPWKTLKEFIDYAKAHPGEIRNSNSGKGASAHIFGEAFDRLTGIKETHVPFAGYSPAVAAVAGGHIEATCIPVGDVLSMAKAGKVRILAVASDERQSLIPDVPTMKEQKINLVTGNWSAFIAPKGTPPEIVEILDNAIQRSVKRPDIISTFQEMGNILIYSGPKAFAEALKAEDVKTRELVESLGLRIAPK
jgi:tripartite-type tricarboxylate transporter receptor subunit TctC